MYSESIQYFVIKRSLNLQNDKTHSTTINTFIGRLQNSEKNHFVFNITNYYRKSLARTLNNY